MTRRFLVIGVFVCGVAVGWLAKDHRQQEPNKAQQPDEISASVPDGNGGRVAVKFVVSGMATTDSDVRSELAPDESAVLLHFFRPGPDRYEYRICNRSQVRRLHINALMCRRHRVIRTESAAVSGPAPCCGVR